MPICRRGRPRSDLKSSGQAKADDGGRGATELCIGALEGHGLWPRSGADATIPRRVTLQIGRCRSAWPRSGGLREVRRLGRRRFGSPAT